MKKSKDQYLESMFVTEDDKKKFENFNRTMAQNAQGPQPNKNQKKK
jgi:hypothetical protein